MCGSILVLACIRNYAFYWDGVAYAWQVENSPFSDIFHQHHLIFTPFCKIIYIALISSGLQVRSLGVMVGVNIVFGLIYLYLCHEIIRRIFPNPRWLAPLGILLIAFSYTFGTFWRNVDAYIIPLTIITIIILRIIPKDSGVFRAGIYEWILLFIAILFHQISALLLPALIFAQWETPSRRRVLSLIINLALLTISLAGVYLLVFYLMSPHLTRPSFFEWISGYAKDSDHTWWIFNRIHGFFNIMFVSFQQSMLSHKFLFISSIKPSIWWGEDKIVIGNYKIYFGLSWFIFTLFILAIVYGIKNQISDSRTRKLVWLLLVYIAPYIIFFQFYCPKASLFRMFYFLPLVIFILAGIKAYIKTRFHKITGLIFLLMFIGINFVFGFIPESFPSSNTYLNDAKAIREQTTKRDLFIFSPHRDSHTFQSRVYLQYFGDRDVIILGNYPVWLLKAMTPEELKNACGESRRWFIQNYDNFYFNIVKNKPEDFIKMTPFVKSRDIPDQLILQMKQIHYLSVIKLNVYVFHKGEIREYGK